MREFIDSHRTANDISMNSAYEGSYLIVEGARDYLLYNKFLNYETCELVSVNGKGNVIEVITLVNKRGNSNTLGIIDSDFQHILGTQANIDNLLETEYHDIETSIFNSPSFDTMVSVHCQEKKLKALSKEIGFTIQEFILNLIKPIGYLKLANTLFNLGLVFKPQSPEGEYPDYSKCYNTSTMEFLGITNLITVLLNYSRTKSSNVAKPAVILSAFEKVSLTNYDLLQICNGHDIIHIFQICLRKKLGNYDRKQYSLKNLEIHFILSYDSSYFSQTNLYSGIKTWEKRKRKTILKF